MDQFDNDDYHYTEVSTYSKVEVLVREGSVISSTKTSTVRASQTKSSTPRKSAPRYVPGSGTPVSKSTTSSIPTKASNPSVSQYHSLVKSVEVKSVEVKSAVSKRKVVPSDASKAPDPQLTEVPGAKCTKPETRAPIPREPTLETLSPKPPPARPLTPTAEIPGGTRTQASLQAVKLCEVHVPHSVSVVKCLGSTSGAKHAEGGTRVTSSLCRCAILRNLRIAGGVVKEVGGALGDRVCSCKTRPVVLVFPSSSIDGSVRGYIVVVAEDGDGRAHFDIRPSNDSNLFAKQGSSEPAVHSTTDGTKLKARTITREPMFECTNAVAVRSGDSRSVTIRGGHEHESTSVVTMPAPVAPRLNLKSLTFD